MLLSKDIVDLERQEKIYIENGWSTDVIECTKTYKIEYLSDDVTVEGYISEPDDIKSKLPVIIWNRGGFREDGILDDFLAVGILGEIASWGYVAMMTNYRDDDELGGKDLDDIFNLISIAEGMTYCDTERMGMEGWSRGGMMLYMTLARTDRFRCAVSVAGLADFKMSSENNIHISEIVKKKLKEMNETEENIINSRSAFRFYAKICPDTPILFLHGTNGDKVNFKESEELYRLLKTKNKETNYELHLFDGDDHYLNKHKSEVAKLRKDWYDRYLLKK
jgi:dipeptidyl aminopeptidase/acylaminoacyl peptidase